MKKIIAFDLDGTLAESKQAITPEMATVISELAQIAKIIVISGGSYLQYAKQFIPQIGTTNLENIILMPTNGTIRYEFREGEWVITKTYPFDAEIKARVMDVLEHIIVDKAFDIPTEHFGEYIEDRETQITFSACGQLAPIEKKSVWDPNREKRINIKHALEEKIPEIEAHIGGMTSVDILPKNFNKASGLLSYLEEQGISKDDMVFIGDAVFPGGNDYSPSQVGIETISTNGPDNTIQIIHSLR